MRNEGIMTLKTLSWNDGGIALQTQSSIGSFRNIQTNRKQPQLMVVPREIGYCIVFYGGVLFGVTEHI